jgi:hypothetical protein
MGMGRSAGQCVGAGDYRHERCRAFRDATVWALFTQCSAIWPLVWRHRAADRANYGIDRPPIAVPTTQRADE